MTDLSKRSKCLLAKGMNSLCCLLPSTNMLKYIIDRGFNNFSQSEAYEVLRYLLFACGVKFSSNPYLLYYIGHQSFKDLPTDQKATVEKLKSDILQELNIFMKKNKVDLNLRKSDLVAPSQAKFLKCALFLTNAALNHQLKNLDVNIPPDIQLEQVEKDDCKKILEDLSEERKQFEIDNPKCKATISGYQHEILGLKKKIVDLKSLKSEVDGLIEDALKNCPDEIKSTNVTAEEKVKCWANQVNKIASENRSRLQTLKHINTNLSTVQSIINGNTRINFLHFKNISHLLSPETLQYCKNIKVNLFHNEDLNINALLEAVLRCIPKDVLNENHMQEILEKKIPTNRAQELLDKLNLSLKKYELLLEDSHSLLDMKINEKTVNEWFNAFFITVPKLRLERNINEEKRMYCNPFIIKKAREKFL